jgi:hypothetical protein
MLSAALVDTHTRIFRRKQFLLGLTLLLFAFAFRSLAVTGVSGQVSLEMMVVPTMVHVAAMSLMTVSILGSTRLTPLLVCGFWTFASVLLECFEHDAAQAWAIRNAPLWVLTAAHQVVSLRQMGVTRGFHLAEVMAALAGGTAAFIYIRNRWDPRRRS